MKKTYVLLVLVMCSLIFSANAQDMNSSLISPSGIHHWMITDAPPADTINGNWIAIANFPAGAYGGINSAWVQADNKVFVAGGNDGFAGITNCYYYDPTANTFAPRAPLPNGRGYGKMVRVRDSLYLVGTVGAAFATPDGAIFRYHPGTNTWVTKAIMPAPLLQEMAVCVWRDSLIITICGSNSGFTGATNTVRVYNPWNDTWTTLAGTFPQTAMSSAATCFGNDIIVVGGYNGTFLNTTHKGVITPGSPISITWTSIGTTPFVGGSVPYRVGDGGVWNGFGLFGPASGSTAQIGQVFGYNYSDGTWRRFLPNTISLAGNRQTMAVRQTVDSVYFYLFGGYTTVAINAAERYAFKAPAPPAVPLCEDFTSVTFPPAGWSLVYTGTAYWTRNAVSGFGIGVGSAKYDMWNASTGTIQSLVTPTITSSVATDSLTFTIAYARYTNNLTAPDSLIIETSTNNGTTWTSFQRLGNAAMETAPAGGEFTPTASQWGKRKYGGLPVGTNKIRFSGKSGFGNNLYLDSICMKSVPVGTPSIGLVPGQFSLSQNYPNPFNPATTIQFNMPKAGNVEVKVFDILGREVAVLVNEFKQVGTHTINFDASGLSSGVYFYTMKSGDFSTTKKMLLIK
jgi:hypothetical protein